MKTQPQRQVGIPRPTKRRIIKKIVTKKLKPKLNLKTDLIVATIQKPVMKKVAATAAKKVAVKGEVVVKRKPGRPFKVKDNAITTVKKPGKCQEMAKNLESVKKEVPTKEKEVPKPKIVAKTKPVPKLLGGKVIKTVPKVKPVVKKAIMKKVGKIETSVEKVAEVEKIKVEDIPKAMATVVEKIEPPVEKEKAVIEKEVAGKDSGNETISKLLKEASKSLGQPIKKKAPVKPKKADAEKEIKVVETKPEKDSKVSEKEVKEKEIKGAEKKVSEKEVKEKEMKGAEKKVSEKEVKEKEMKGAEKKVSEKEIKEKETKAAEKKVSEKEVKEKDTKAAEKEVKTTKSIGKNVEKDIKTAEKVGKEVKSAEKVVKEVKGAKNIEKEVKNMEAKSVETKSKITKASKINPSEESELKKTKIPDTKLGLKKQEVPDKIKQEEYDEDESDEQPLSTKISALNEKKSKNNEKAQVKIEPESEPDQSSETAEDNKPLSKARKRKSSKLLLKKRLLKEIEEQKVRKLVSFWNGPKRHREASLNALAKVHCLYENESRGAFMELLKPKRAPSEKTTDSEPPSPPSQRNLRSTPGVRSGPGKHWDMPCTSSSEERSSSPESYENQEYKPSKKVYIKSKPTPKKEKPPPKVAAKRRNRTEIVMDLKDMVVRKRMASLNATAILAASYSPEKCSSKSSSDDDSSDESDNSDSTRGKGKRHHYEKDKVISNKKKVSVIVNQDTDVTITGVYVNSTTRSTHLHEGYCSIAGMQYMISATSHTQTNATAVSTETLLCTSPHEDQNASATTSNNPEQPTTTAPLQPCKSYTPLSALSNMQPPGAQPNANSGVSSGVNPVVQPPAPPSSLSPIPIGPNRVRHSCSSAFSAPPYGPPPPHPHHHLHPKVEHPPPHGYIHGYYQPAGPLISHHPHSQMTVPPPSLLGPISSGKISAPLPSLETTTPSSPLSQQPPAPSSAGESSDNDVVITAASNSSANDTPHPIPQPPNLPPSAGFRYTSYSTPSNGPPPGYGSYYPPSPQYYTSPQYGPPHYHHQELCYPSSAPYPSYYHSKTYGTPSGSYHRRYITAPPSHQYYPQDIYSMQAGQQSTQIVSNSLTATGSSGPSGTFQSPSGPPPAPTMVESFQPPPAGPISIVEPYPGPPSHYYPGYNAPPSHPACYSHSPPGRGLSYIDASYQSCPCPMQSCPKNVHTGPLTGDGKRPNMTVIAKESTGLPLPPVALALPQEPASVNGPPSPARGSAGMPPPPSPAGATYQPVSTPKQEQTNPSPTTEQKPDVPEKVQKKARVGKNMVRNTIASNFTYRQTENTLLLMCHSTAAVKREALSPENIIEKQVPSIQITPVEDSAETMVSSTEVEKETVVITVIQEGKEQSKDSPDTTTNEEGLQTDNIETCSKVEVEKDDVVESTVSEEEPVKGVIEKEEGGTKRKLSVDQENNNNNVPTPKKQKSSYKDLINKNPSTIQISNGRRKLNSPNKTKISPAKPKKPKIVSNTTLSVKRKLETTIGANKKQRRILMASTLPNTEQNLKEKGEVKKTAPEILDRLLALSSIDRTIDNVIKNCMSPQEDEQQEKIKEDFEPVSVNERIEEEIIEKEEEPKTVVVVEKEEVKPEVKSTSKPVRRKSKCIAKWRTRAKRKPKFIAPIEIVEEISKVPRRLSVLPRWSNGWSWEGSSYTARVFLNSDDTVVTRTCYPAMRHAEGDIIQPRDCVLLKSGQRKGDLPFVAKISALWENPEDGEMMMSLLWFYRPEHTEQGRLPTDHPSEVFASRHKDTNSVACIEDKCYVLTFFEYCRYYKNVRTIDDESIEPEHIVPTPDGEFYPRKNRLPPTTQTTSPDLILFCSRVYDFRQKRLIKNPN